MAARSDPLATLIRLFLLQNAVSLTAAEAALGAELVAALEALELVRASSDQISSLVDITPFVDDFDGSIGWVISDHPPVRNGLMRPPAPDFVLGLSPASVTLANLTPRRRAGTALDLGTGSGIQALHLVRHASKVVATDLNPRAIKLAELTFLLNEVDVEVRLGSLYEPVAGQTFDLITTNPPFVISPPSAEKLMYRETAYLSDGLMSEVISGAAKHLNTNGSLHVLGNWAVVTGQSSEDRFRDWLPAGCEAFVVEREKLDPYEYAEVWLADAGLVGTPEYSERLAAWVDYFHQHSVEAVAMGWVTVVKTGASQPRVRYEVWPHAVKQPVADDLVAHVLAAPVADWSDAAILASSWKLADGTVQETFGAPGASDPKTVILRRAEGLARAEQVGTALGGVLGASDGTLPLGAIISAVATLLDDDDARLRAELLPHIRRLIGDTWLTPA